MTTITLPAPAKLNLFLHINGRRDDGYHNLQTLFQLLDFGDELTFTVTNDEHIHFTCSHPELAGDDNLVVRAATMLLNHTNKTNDLGISIYLEKRLPFGGGIGGGSSDAATTFLALNKLWNLQLDIDELADLGRTLGADIPVFIRGRSAFAEGVGEILQPVDLPKKWFIVLAPDCHVSTAKIFSHKRLTRDTPIIKVAASSERGTKNDCQALVIELYPEVKEALTWLSQFGDARMTGTGSCVFLGVNSQETARTIIDQKPSHINGFVAEGVNNSTTVEMLNRA